MRPVLNMTLCMHDLNLICSFLRFPGGCYVEGGDWLKDRFQWKQSLGPAVDRPGHYNEIWGYWSTDGVQSNSYFLVITSYLLAITPAGQGVICQASCIGGTEQNTMSSVQKRSGVSARTPCRTVCCSRLTVC